MEDSYLELQNKILVRKIAEELLTKIDSEPFLHIFDDRFNKFGYLGITEQDYQDLARRVRQAREDIMDNTPKQKVLKKN